jgi:hypothetical protein
MGKIMQAFYKPSKLFNVDENAKTIKGQKYGFRTLVLYLAPYKLSGVNICPMAEAAHCIEACLNEAGNPAYAETKRKGRLNKTVYFLQAKNDFINQLIREIVLEQSKAKRDGFELLIRLNGTSDIRWENQSFTLSPKLAKVLGLQAREYRNIMQVFPNVQFYDYTKIPNRKDLPKNYDLTFSYSGVLGFQKYAEKAIESGMRLAVVFRDKKTIPETFLNMQCVDGDDSDIRHLDPHGVVVALYAKGPAKKDFSGFVIDAGKKIIPLKLAA